MKGQVTGNILDEIVFYKKESLEQQKKEVPLGILKKEISNLKQTRDFAKAISGEGINPVREGLSNGVNIIAEIKKASPSKGIIRKDFDPVQIARIYEENGAKAISVLTEEKYFLGNIDYLNKVKDVTNLPILRKDFIFDEYQIYEARVKGADAALLIAGILDKKELKDFLELSRSLGMGCLVEVHNKEELKKVLSTDAKIIGINNRDLKTFKIDINTTINLIKEIPSDRMVVSESGINTHKDILKLKDAGVKAFLVGEALMKEHDIGKKLREIKGID
ncbi:MAG: indole-3-glycerol phosphate synthase TrpC [Deltaproteobacteria bacterium]|nr:indole-3-glycerol phosphate synthase TrpC [Deltaproteobacteria bacterium]